MLLLLLLVVLLVLLVLLLLVLLLLLLLLLLVLLLLLRWRRRGQHALILGRTSERSTIHVRRLRISHMYIQLGGRSEMNRTCGLGSYGWQFGDAGSTLRHDG